MTSRVDALLKRYRALDRDRGLWLRHWDDLARVELPRRMGFVTQLIEGQQRVDELFDGTAMQAARSLANALGGMLRPEGQPWFFLKTADDADEATSEAKDWLADTEERMRKALDDPRARFRQATGEVDLDLVVLGTGEMFAGEIVGGGQLLFQALNIKDGLPIFDESGNLEGMFRCRKLTIRQAIERFGVNNLSERTRSKVAGNENSDKLDEKVEFLFACLPRKEGRADALIARNLPIADIVIEVDAKHEVAVSGYHELPYVVPRWDTSSGESYGRSPGMIALPDANTSQAIGETMLIAGQRAADPPLLAPSDAFVDAPNTFPGGIAYYEADAVRDLGNAPIRELVSRGNFPLSRDIQQDTREQIRNAFHRDIFKLPPPGEQTMTATEVIARQQEFIREMGPVFGRFETDYTAPIIERVFHIMLRGGGFLPIPDALSNKSVRFEYESPVKRIREQAQAQAAQVWVQDKVRIATETQDQKWLDVVDADAYGKFDAQAHGIPHELIASEDKIMQKRQQRQQEQQMQAEMAMVQQGASAAKDAGAAAKSSGLVEQPGQAA